MLNNGRQHSDADFLYERLGANANIEAGKRYFGNLKDNATEPAAPDGSTVRIGND